VQALKWLDEYYNDMFLILKKSSRNNLFNIFLKLKSWFEYVRKINIAVSQSEYDIIQYEWTESIMFSFPGGKSFTILDTHDIKNILIKRKIKLINNPIKSILYSFYYLIYKQLENHSIRKADMVLAKSNFDLQYINRIISHSNSKVLSCPIKPELKQEKWMVEKSQKIVLFIGELSRYENDISLRNICLNIWPNFIENQPQYKFVIIGKGPSEELQEISQKDSSIIIMGYVKDIVSHYITARMFVAPMLIGGGIIVKILDSLTIGVPTITTEYGNQGLDCKDGSSILIAKDNEDVLIKMIQIAESDQFASDLSSEGREYALETFNFEQEMKHIYTNL
jgi:glycosyltransferase involved in cell wall biosynthesis